MAERAPTSAPALEVQALFPPIPTEAWEAAIAQDLKGADYEKKLVWRLDEGIAVRPYYRRDPDRPAPPDDPLPAARGTGEAWQAIAPDALPGDAVRADRLHDAGAHAVQELACAIAEGVERLAKATEAGTPVAAAAPRLAFVFAVGSTYFLEIAKLRAARLLWAQAVAAFGPADPSIARMRLYVRTARANKSLADPYTNLLRATTEAMAAAIGGADAVAVEAFGFDPHLAANVPRILGEEAQLTAVLDPAGGSYFVEALTDALAREAWTLFQQIEQEGGYAAAQAAGRIEAAIAVTAAARARAVASRRRTLVGVNNYPDLGPAPALETPAPGDDDLPLGQPRLAEPFEALRRRTQRHAAATGRTPRVLLLLRGDVVMRTARANFCQNLFGCAGFDIVQSDTVQPADLVVLCSSDPEYPALAAEIVPQSTAPVIVAGNPKDAIDTLRAAGIQDFVHLGSNAVEVLTNWQQRLGIPVQGTRDEGRGN
jgi:methylmalonyl-CoA mutase